MMSHKSGCALVIAACLLLSACGGGGGGGGGAGSNAPPFPTTSEDQLPPGTRIDVSTKNLFQMGAGDSWTYTKLDKSGNLVGTASRQVTSGPDASGRVSITDYDGGSSTTTYIVSADGLLDPSPLGSGVPASAANIVGAIFEYATPLYPVGAERKHVRSGPWGQDLDGDGIGESFRYEFTQVFLGFETAQFSGVFTLKDVAHFSNVFKVTLRPTAPGNTDYAITVSEETWFAPGLGLVKALRSVVDSDGVTLDQPHTLLFSSGYIAGVNWNISAPPPVLDGSFVDVPLAHNALVYDSVRNVYYASVPGSVIGNGNRIATIEPVTGQVSYSAPVGSEPKALALAADASVLYVGLDGSGDVVKLALPSMTELGRAKLVSDPFFGQSHAETIAVSPADATVVAVSMAWSGVSPRHAGAALLRDMVMQPKRTQVHTGSNLVAFDAAGAKVYGLNNETTEFGLRRIQVLADGLVQELVVAAATSFATSALGFANNRVIAGSTLYDAPALTAAGVISGATDCVPGRSSALLLCLRTADFSTGRGSLLIADSGTFVIKASLLYALSEPFAGTSRRLVEGPAGQVAIGYPVSGSGSVSKIRLFSSAQLLTPPTPPAVAWPVTSSSTADGQALDVGIVHNGLVYDNTRNLYYASVPGSVIGSGNSIAVIDPATGQVTHSAPVGSEPNALAIAADASVLYAGLDGSGDVVKLALPSMAELGRVKLVTDPFFGQSHAETIAVSPGDANVAAVSMAWTGFSPRHAGAALLRNMVMQPRRTQVHTGSNLVAFDAAGATLYGLNTETTEFGLRRIQVLADGLVQDLVVTAATGFMTRALGFANGRVIAGRALYDAPALTSAGVISSASDCWAQRTGTQLLCLGDVSTPGRVLLASSTTFVIGGSLVYAVSEQDTPRRLVQGPGGQIAVSYTSPFFSSPKVRLFSSAHLP
jgi:hypothetical protein